MVVEHSCPAGELEPELRYLLYLPHNGCLLPSVPLANHFPSCSSWVDIVEVSKAHQDFAISGNHSHLTSDPAGSHSLYPGYLLGQLHELCSGITAECMAI